MPFSLIAGRRLWSWSCAGTSASKRENSIGMTHEMSDDKTGEVVATTVIVGL
jgi:hypothetical protein